MAGYHNFSMSNNAVFAYANGEKPLSKWTKAAIIEAAEEYLKDDENAEKKLEWLRAGRLDNLKRFALRQSSWHHTSCRYNSTDFYSLDEYALDDMTEEEAAELKKKPERRNISGRRAGAIEYIIWGGSRRHPRAYQRRLENVEIEEKGSFYLVYQNDNLILRKKIDSNGTHVFYK